MKKIEIKQGDRHGILTILKEIDPIFATRGDKIRRVLCLCDCGKKVEVFLTNLRKVGHTTSCGCIRTKRIINFIKDGGHYVKHGMWGTPEYKAWNGMKQRCSNPNNYKYHLYGGRGIKVCDSWNIFENFLKDMGPRPKGTSIDRINSNGNYEPNNCRWATIIEQNNHLSSNRMILHKGKTQSVAMWARELNMSVGAIRSRLHAGWDPIDALIIPTKVLTK